MSALRGEGVFGAFGGYRHCTLRCQYCHGTPPVH